MIGALVPAARAGSLLLNSSSLLLLHEAAAAAAWPDNDTLSGPGGVAAVLGEAGVRAAPRHLSTAAQAVITASYVLGVVGNAAALLILSREGRASAGSSGVGRNAGKHALMLRCLACNDLVALLGMLVLMHLQLYLPPSLSSTRAFCAARVTMRLFGLGSGVVALVMAAERWLALSHPFLYQQHVTYHVIRRAIFSLWAGVVLLVYLPLLGFGLYYDEGPPQRCLRYRQATDPAGIAYAYVYFTFGSLLCLGIVCFNLAVMRVLCSIGRRSILDRRVSSRSTTNSQVHNASYRSLGQQAMTARHNAATHEELAFARLMVALCVIFGLCWMPQMLAIPLSRFAPKTQPLLRAADILMAFHFALDPYIYVLLRCRRRPCVQAVFKLLCRPLRPKTGSLRSLPATAEVNISLHDASRPRSSFTSSDVAVTPQIKRTSEPVSKDVSEHL